MSPTADWWFRPEPPDRSRDFGNANIWSFKPGLSSFVREVGQNTLDVRVATTVDLTFRIIRLKDDELADFLDAMHWDTGLRPHIEASAASGQKLGRSLQSGLSRLDETGELVLLRVEEKGARGLVGDEFGSGSNFVGLCRNNLDSAKTSGTAGGAFGLGKAVLWRTSMLSTVLFNSDIDVTDEKDDRLIGRAELAWHESGGSAFAGPGWFGDVEGSKPAESLWGDADLARRLCLTRPDSSTGTSILVVGFHDPTDDSDPSDDKLADGLRHAIAANFWPALESGRLAASVEICHGRDDSRLVEQKVVDAETMQPTLVATLRAHTAGEVTDELAHAGDVVRLEASITVPAHKEGNHGETAHQVQVLVRRGSADDPDSGRTVFFRGTEMIIETRDFRAIRVGACPFHAVVLCGQAAGDTPEATIAEEFLRAAEPPAHNSWELTEDVRVLYTRGGGANLERFFEEVRAAIRSVVGPPTSDLSDGPRGLKELFRITPPRPQPSKRPEVSRAGGAVGADGSWEVSARIQVHDTSQSWSGRPTVVFGAETGGGSRVKWAELTAQRNCTVDGHTIVIPSGVSYADFTGRTDPDSHPVPAATSAISVEFLDAQPTNA